MSPRLKYGLVMVAILVVIGAGAAFSISKTYGWRVPGPWFTVEPTAGQVARVRVRSSRPTLAGSARSTEGPPAPDTTTPTVPSAPTPVVPATTGVATVGAKPQLRVAAKPVWKPSPEQTLRDKVYFAGQQNRTDDAIAALEAWLEKHPTDTVQLRELARLLVRSGRTDDALDRYRQALAVRSDAAVRAEYSAALLAGQRYDSAAANYRTLVTADSGNVEYHLGLGRSLAWGGHPRAAEPELHWLVTRMPSDTLLVTMLRLARGAYDPPSEEAARWVAEDSAFTPYHLALARAHVRESHPALAREHFDRVLAAGETLGLLREAAGAFATANDSIGNARLLGRAVALAPRDFALRRSYAQALAWSGDRTLAIAQYDTLLASGPQADLLFARGQLHALVGHRDRAISDLAASVTIKENPDALVMLGDLYRWRGDRVLALAAYIRASALRPGDTRAMAGMALIDAAERRDAEAVLAQSDLGWSPFVSYLGDNTGFDLYAAGLRGAVPAGLRTVLMLSADARRLDDFSGWSLGTGFVHHASQLRIAADGGLSRLDGLGTFGFGSIGASMPWDRVMTSFDLRAGPAYPLLMSAANVSYLGATVAASIPIGAAALSTGVERIWLSDGNARTSMQLGARYPLAYGLSAVYYGGLIGFDRRTDGYWDPHRFTSHSIGLELSTHVDSGLTFTARLLPGLGLSTDIVEGSTSPIDRRAAQLSTGFLLDYRRRWWGFSLDGDYAQGVRGTGYHSARARARVRISP